MMHLCQLGCSMLSDVSNLHFRSAWVKLMDEPRNEKFHEEEARWGGCGDVGMCMDMCLVQKLLSECSEWSEMPRK